MNEEQYMRLSEEICPATDIRIENRSVPLRHALQAVTSRSWRDLFRKRRYWRCWYCNLREEIQR